MLTEDKFDVRGFLHKIEIEEGTDSVPTPAANGIQLIDGQVEIQNEKRTRNLDNPKGGAKPFILAQRRALITGSIELVGNMAAGQPSPYSSLIRSAGNTQTLLTASAGPPQVFDAVQHRPILKNVPSASSYFYHDGEFFRVLGSRSRFLTATLPINAEPTASQETLGKVVQVAEQDVPADIDLSAFGDPVVGTEDTQSGVFADMSLLLDGVPLDGIEIRWDFGVDLAMRYSTESTRALIRAREITGTLKIFRPLVATSDIRSMVEAHAKVPLLVDYAHVDEWRNQSWLFPRIQLEEPRRVNENNDKAWEIAFTALPDAGDDDYTWTLGKRPA